MSALDAIAAPARRAVWLIGATAILASLSYATLQTRSGAWVTFWHRANLTSFTHDSGHAYSSPTGVPDQSSHQRPSPAHVFEDGRLLGPANASRESIQALGAGRYAFWHDAVLFSASDNSDPARNGRLYVIAYPPIPRSAARFLYAATAILALATGAVLLWLVRLAGVGPLLGALVAAGAQLFAVARSAPVVDPIKRRRLRKATIGLWILVMLLVAASETALQTRKGEWTWLWRDAPIGALQAEQGFAFVGQTGRPEIGSHVSPEPTGLLEDGVQLGLRNALHSEIREVGRGRYSFWHDHVLFAASDNSDPRTNGRRYTIVFPPISRQGARLLYALTLLVFMVSIVVSWAGLRAGAIRVPDGVAIFVSRYALAIVTVITAGSLVLPALLRASPGTAPLADDLWNVVLPLQLALAIGVRVWWGSRVPPLLGTACLAAVAIGFFSLTVWAPHRTQGCHTNGASYPVWSVYCVAPDSASYYMGYGVGSTRQPMYPWFIDAVTAGTGFDRRQFVNTVKPGAPRFDSDPLFRVVRMQVVVLLLAALVACAAMIGLLGSTLPATVFLWLCDQQYFSAGEINIVLTEPLVQAFVMVLVAAFAAFLARRRPGLLPVAGAACGLAYLTRQAAVYAAVLLGAAILVALAQDWRRRWQWCAGSLAIFVALCAVPDAYVFLKTGDLARQQTHLQYQYRIAHAMQYATPADVALMPDEESRAWLADAIVRRDEAHRRVEQKFPDDELNRMIYYIAGNLYEVATPIAGFAGENKTPEFYMKVATPILQRHWAEYARFSFRFWQFGLTRPGLTRLADIDVSMWIVYAVLLALILLLRSIGALASAAMIAAHWGAVAIICLAAVPIPRMINASEFLVVLAATILVFECTVRYVVPLLPGRGKEPA